MAYALPYTIAVVYAVLVNLAWYLAVRRADAHTARYAAHTPKEDPC